MGSMFNQTNFKVFLMLLLFISIHSCNQTSNKVIPILIDNKEYEQIKSISTDSKDILTSDSTKVSVVTGYSENSRKIVRMNYILKNDVIDKIKSSTHIMFRYYSGPSMITLNLKGFNFEKLKKALNKM